MHVKIIERLLHDLLHRVALSELLRAISSEIALRSWLPPAESSYPIEYAPNYFDNINSTFLFNIREDPEERNELSKVYPEMVNNLMRRLKEYNATAVPVRYPKPDPASLPELHGNVWAPWEL